MPDHHPEGVTVPVHPGLEQREPNPASVTGSVQTGLEELRIKMQMLDRQQERWERQHAKMNGLAQWPQWFHWATKGGICGQCGHRFAPDEPVVIAHLTIWRPTARPHYSQPSRHRYTLGLCCAGTIEGKAGYRCTVCNREVIGERTFGHKRHPDCLFPGETWVNNPCCSMTCYESMIKRQKRLHERNYRDTRACICGNTITRPNALHCSSACRQKAYRQRSASQ
jgi:hypothetical protein